MLVDSKRVVEFVSFVQEPVGIDFVLDFTAFVHEQEVVASAAKEGEEENADRCCDWNHKWLCHVVGGSWMAWLFRRCCSLAGTACSELSTSTIGNGGR